MCFVCMNKLYEKLFDAYGDLLLKDARIYNEEEINQQLRRLPLDSHTLQTVDNLFFDCYFRWSTAAFAAGIHLGLTLLHDDIRRLRPQ